jgi:deoxyribose-phosphate aldolase
MVKIMEEELVRYIDQTNLKSEATEDEMICFLQEAKKYRFYAASILPSWMPLGAKILQGSETRVDAVIGFPLGTVPTELKVVETKWAIENGTPEMEIDMVMNVSLLKSRKYGFVKGDISAVIKAAEGNTVKVIIEVPLLTPEEVVIASLICEIAGAQFVKTSTGFKGLAGWRPTTIEDVKLIKSVVGNTLKVKAAGGIRTIDKVLAMIEAGADRIGTSSGVPIVEEYRKFKKREIMR